MTRFCVDVGDGAPFELYSLSDLDEIEVSGNNTMDVCHLLNTDGDAFANFAVCVSLDAVGGAGGNQTGLKSVRLFTCNDTKAGRCMGAVEIPGTHNTTCEVSHPDTDPFSPAAVNGPGDAYPFDSEVVCGIDTNDFGLGGAIPRLLDACSFPSSQPNSDAEDCILYSACTTAAVCDDGNECTQDSCDPSGVCFHAANDGIACSDGLFCTGEETCNFLGFCGRNPDVLSCDDGVDCTIDDCDEMQAACVHDPRASLCDNALFCDGVESCDATSGCVAGSPPDCRDDADCTIDFCDETGASCGHRPDDAACDDGVMCNGVEICSGQGGCLAGPPVDCSDGVACTVDACDEGAKSCRHSPDDGACADAQFCNGTEVCNAATGCAPGLPVTCADGVGCTLDACSEDADLCVHAADNSSCDDGQYCNGVETCGIAGCEPGDVPCAGQARCDEQDDVCLGCRTDDDCTDGVFCNGREACVAGSCKPGPPESCNDGVACTLDTCNEAAGACDHRPSDALCDDDRFCNGAERCDSTAGCESGLAPACDDGIGCTADSCSTATDICTHAPQDSACDDGRICNGRETCSAIAGCEEGQELSCPADGFQCSIESCSESANGCRSDFSRCVCGDREIVASEECDPPSRAGTYEDCNNLIDDDHDGMTDCEDPGCQPGSGQARRCDENCRINLLCERVARDPAMIRFDRHGGPDMFWIHGRFPVAGAPDPEGSGFEIQVSNEIQPIFRASLGAYDLEASASDSGTYYFQDSEARLLGNESARGGLSTVGIILRSVEGVPYLAFRVRAYGDLSNATQRFMTSQITVGEDVGSLTTEWKAAKRKWTLRQRDF